MQERNSDRNTRKNLERLPGVVGMVSEKPTAHLELMFVKHDKDDKKRFYHYIKIGKKTWTCFYTDQVIYQQQTEKVTTLNDFFNLVFTDKVFQASMISTRAQREQLLAVGEDQVQDYL